MHDLHIGQSVMYLNPMNKDGIQPNRKPLPRTQNYKIETDNGTIYGTTQNHLNLYQ